MKKKTFLIADNEKESMVKKPDHHPWFIITDPDIDDNVLIVNSSSVYNSDGTKRSFIDDSCLLFKGDHETIRHESYIVYKRAKAISAKQLMFKEQLLIITPKKDINDNVLKRLQEGARKSKFLPIEFEKYFEYF